MGNCRSDFAASLNEVEPIPLPASPLKGEEKSLLASWFCFHVRLGCVRFRPDWRLSHWGGGQHQKAAIELVKFRASIPSLNAMESPL